ncbi:MAG: methyltransferase [Paracoccaceae bacterium]
MSFSDDNLSCDDFLGGQIQIWQPKDGYRAATDPVFLAAAIDAKPGQSVLELGCGAGVALACLCHRVPDLNACGLEIQPDYAALAVRNAVHNDLDFAVHVADLLAMPEALRQQDFDQVFANPPFYAANASSAPQDAGKNTAHREGVATLGDWISAGLRRLKPRGYFTMIHRTERLPDILAALENKAGDIRILPLCARKNRDAGRVIVRARKGAAGPLRLLAPLVIHTGTAHGFDADNYTPIARNILRNTQPIVL